MRHLIMVMAMLLLPISAWGQADPAADDDSAETLDAAADEVVEAVDKLVNNTPTDFNGWVFGVAALLAALFRLALQVLRRYGKLWFRDARVLKIVCAALGLAIFIALCFVPGVDWYEAVIVGLSGPGAVLFNEFTKWQKKPTEEDPT